MRLTPHWLSRSSMKSAVVLAICVSILLVGSRFRPLPRTSRSSRYEGCSGTFAVLALTLATQRRRVRHDAMADGRVVVVTGASAGIGRAVAIQCGRRGDRVALLARGTEGLAGASREVIA